MAAGMDSLQQGTGKCGRCLSGNIFSVSSLEEDLCKWRTFKSMADPGSLKSMQKEILSWTKIPANEERNDWLSGRTNKRGNW